MLISFLPKTDTSYLFDFEALVEHFQEHNKKENIDFWRFFLLHYTQHQHKTKDESHKQLPLQHHHVECVSFIVLPNPYFAMNTPIAAIAERQNYIIWQSFYCFQLSNENFQPPRA